MTARFRIFFAWLTVLTGIYYQHGLALAGSLVLGFENQEQLGHWQEITFPGEKRTRYEFDPKEQMVCAWADGSASALVYMFSGDLKDYPVLSWEWRIERTLAKGNARVKEGDDYAGRVYVNFSGDERLSWWERTRKKFFELFYGREIPGQALNFIWANVLERGEIVSSPYTRHTRLKAMQSGNQRAGEWVREEVNIPAEYRRAFNGEPPRVHSIAVMTDSDDTGEVVRACYRHLVLKDGARR